jgi:4'-phosphopantetheinyl transferase
MVHRPPSDHGAWSLSHSGGYAGLALGSAGLLLGVDLERVRPRRILDLAASWFTPREFDQLSGLPPADQEAHFYVLWTLKEACTKALGLELLKALRECVWWSDAEGWHAELPVKRPWRAWVFAPQSDLRLALFAVGEHVAEFPATHGWPAEKTAEWPCLMDLAG